ncbi:MAG TPA: AAA family ATPase [Ohtaekwangia sp.]|uniref:AAA family ATPase n=1 Tax=Ohtaekwangia sp. TaxID=2066019 RepID=UPI002F94370D
MKRGLVIGKFLPIHKGHIALIEFAAERCDELIVSMSYTDHDAIDASLRFSWIAQLFKDRPSVKPAMVRDDFDNEQLAWPERTKVWADFIRKTYPPVDILFSSEVYGEPFAANLGAISIVFDADREKFPVAASLIRQHPFKYWEYIPDIVRPYFVKKICFYGPESTGKSTMAERMAAHYKTVFVPEVARELLTSNVFTLKDIETIGHAHADRIKEKSKVANKILFCDTDAITTQIYSQYYLHAVPDAIYTLEKDVHYDLYFLFDIDVPWVADELRDLGNQREKMLEIFRSELIRRNIPYIFVRGSFEEREVIIKTAIDQLLI